ncbi:disease resistance protein RPP13-like [Magnolia sinica]|uniref:disease resistance protein RPP13-like n=1 Tax=Magnolia sinica TaxID=86752 RepID=UPI00265B61CE|nr:disease resistance protein RPP13-like [Magnolia sinica]XP_058114444.1 disease resistance protein RPP13-like [Magnolia sinica]
MTVIESVVELLLEKLADPIIQEAILLYRVREQVELLVAEFRRMRCFLKDADAKQEGDERVKNWVWDVRDVAYDAEDVIDTFLFKVAPPLRRRGFVGHIRNAFTRKEVTARHKVGLEIERIKNKIRTISDSRSTYGIENIGQQAGTSSAGRSLREWRLTSPLSQEPDFVGFEKDMEIVVAQLMEGESRRCVVSVVGMGGLGKTTLIRKVYNSTRVKTHFHFCEWISISQEYSVKDLLQNIIYCHMVLSEEDLKKVQKMNVFELSHKISLYLQEKRYLMVLDDIWKMEAWDALKDAFPDVNNGSRVVLTTRNKGVALYADPLSQPHELRFLTNEESWDLFCKKTLILVRDGGCLQDLEKLGREIVEKCHGLPLAIAVIGGLLSVKEPREWENVRKSISWQFVKGEVKISHILSLSYKDLPYYLKPCFLYLGNFPEDREFGAKELIQMWAAEGFLQQRGEETLEEVGDDCLKELIQRSMVQVAIRNSSGNIKSCCIHDLLRNLAISEAKEGMFLQVHSGNANVPLASRARRVAIHHNNSSEYTSFSSSTPHLRSVLIYNESDAWLQRKEAKFLFRSFKLLRVLYIHGAYIKKLPKAIGKLIHLRYLGCAGTSLERLPSSIGNLPNLQTLFVASSYNIEVPDTIEKMQQLGHFQVKSTFNEKLVPCIVEIKGRPRLDRINSLQTLSLVRYGKWMEDGCLGKLTNLRKLGIWVDTKADAKVLYESIVNLDCLHSLKLQGNLAKLPDSSFFPTNLTKLTLKYSYLEEDPMAMLEKLKNLRILRLLNRSYIRKEMACSVQGFPRLESLHLRQLSHLEEWRVEEGAMPSLLHLNIGQCDELKKLPEGLQHVSTLNKLELWRMPDEFKARLEEDGGEDWYKIRHIPSIDISDRMI